MWPGYVGLQLMIFVPLLPNAGVTGTFHHTWSPSTFNKQLQYYCVPRWDVGANFQLDRI